MNEVEIAVSEVEIAVMKLKYCHGGLEIAVNEAEIAVTLLGHRTTIPPNRFSLRC